MASYATESRISYVPNADSGRYADTPMHQLATLVLFVLANRLSFNRVRLEKVCTKINATFITTSYLVGFVFCIDVDSQWKEDWQSASVTNWLLVNACAGCTSCGCVWRL